MLTLSSKQRAVPDLELNAEPVVKKLMGNEYYLNKQANKHTNWDFRNLGVTELNTLGVHFP